MNQLINLQDELTPEAMIALHPYQSYLDEDSDEFLISRTDTSDYISLSQDAMQILKKLESGLSLGKVTAEFEEFGLTSEDLKEFVISLVESQLIYTVNGKEVTEKSEKKNDKSVRPSWFSRIMFTPTAWIVYGILAIANVLLLWLKPELRPLGSDLFVSSSGLLSFLVIICGTWVVVFFHEFGHVYAAQKVGIPAKINWGYRAALLVVETDVSDIWAVPRKKRFGVYLGGPAWTSTVIFLMLIAQSLPLPDLVIRIFRFFVLLQMQTFVFQTLLFLKTDMYYVISNYFKFDTLNELSNFVFKNMLLLRFPRIFKEFDQLNQQEKSLVRGYMLYNVIGFFIAIALFIWIDIPVLIEYVHRTVERLLYAPLFSIQYWDGIALGTLVLNPIIILIVYVTIDWIKVRKLRQQVKFVS